MLTKPWGDHNWAYGRILEGRSHERRFLTCSSITKNVRNDSLSRYIMDGGSCLLGNTGNHCQGGSSLVLSKNVTVYWGWIRLTSIVGLNAGIVYNSDPTSRIFNFRSRIDIENLILKPVCFLAFFWFEAIFSGKSALEVFGVYTL